MAANMSGLSGISDVTTCDTSSFLVSGGSKLHALPVKTEVASDTIRLDFEMKLPKREKPPKPKPPPPPPPPKQVVEAKVQVSQLSDVFRGRTDRKRGEAGRGGGMQGSGFPQPVYFQEVDCVGLPGLLTEKECARIVEFAEAQGFSRQNRHTQLRFQWSDIMDPFLCEGIWMLCGLGDFLDRIVVDGMVPCGLNDIVRIQKYEEGDLFGRHTDQHVRRNDGRVSKYSLRVFLNGLEEGSFEGGLSAFHVRHLSKPVVLEPEAGLALLYPQGDLCTVQEEMEVRSGCKYVLRADILFCRPEDLARHRQ